MDPKWLEWVKSLQAVAQTGLHYARDPFDIERYHRIQQIASEIAANHCRAGVSNISGLFENEKGHATPKIDVRGAVFSRDSILLVRERQDGLWTLPGGWADVEESPSRAVAREIFEETGYHATVVKLLAVYDRNTQGHPPYPFNAYKLFFLCELCGGAPACSLETDESAFFSENNLPGLSLPRVTPRQIKRLFEHHRHPDLPTDFD